MKYSPNDCSLSKAVKEVRHFVNTFTIIFQPCIKCKVTANLKNQVLAAAKELFLTHGFASVGMRDIASAVGKQPIQIYRLNLSKEDILAELIIELNAAQIDQLPALSAKVQGHTLADKVCGYFRELYALDIRYLPIRSVGAAYGWMWNSTYEQKIVGQVMTLLQPVIGWMSEAGIDQIESRCYGIWSVYYVGFRNAVIHGCNAHDCITKVRPSMEILLSH